MILDSGEAVSFVAFSVFFFEVVGPLLHELSVPGRSFVLGARNCTAEGYDPVCTLLKCVFFMFFPHCLFFQRRVQRWTGNDRQNSNDVCDIV